MFLGSSQLYLFPVSKGEGGKRGTGEKLLDKTRWQTWLSSRRDSAHSIREAKKLVCFFSVLPNVFFPSDSWQTWNIYNSNHQEGLLQFLTQTSPAFGKMEQKSKIKLLKEIKRIVLSTKDNLETRWGYTRVYFTIVTTFMYIWSFSQ